MALAGVLIYSGIMGWSSPQFSLIEMALSGLGALGLYLSVMLAIHALAPDSASAEKKPDLD